MPERRREEKGKGEKLAVKLHLRKADSTVTD